MLSVLITVDVEIWPQGWDLSPERFRRDFERYILGPTSRGALGLPGQLERLARHRQKAIFLVESLFACEFGIEPLAEIVALIGAGGQETGLHLHPEWVGKVRASPLPGRKGRRMSDYTVDEQAHLLSVGRDHLRAAGATQVHGFRAGGYAANRDTLRALAQVGIPFDTSYNPCILGAEGGIAADGPLERPRRIEGVWEFPVAAFEDWPGHRRHAQLGACSFAELAAMLDRAERSGWRHFTIVSHGFELLNPAKTHADAIVVRRFERLLAFLAAHPDRFRTVGFGDIDPGDLDTAGAYTPLRSHPARTLWRHGEQLARRLLA